MATPKGEPVRMRVAVAGATGRLGSALVGMAPALNWEAIPLTRRVVDFERLENLQRDLDGLEFDALVNAAGLTDVEQCEADPERAWTLNAEAPWLLAQSCAARGAAFVHVSTDYVFSGKEPGLRRESDPTGPVNAYGRSKEAGERAVLMQAAPRTWVARVAWLFGSGRGSAFDSILERARVDEEVALVADKYSSPTYCEDAVRAIDFLVRCEGPGGVVHVVNEGCVSWWEYGCGIVETARRLGWELRVRRLVPRSLRSMTRWKAERPVHTALAADVIGGWMGKRMRPWAAAAEEYLKRLTAAGHSAP